MSITREDGPIRRKLLQGGRLAACVFCRGLVDLFRYPTASADYWRRIVSAALCSVEGDCRELLSLPRCNIDQIIPEAEGIPVTLIECQCSYGDMLVWELITLCRIVRYRQPAVVFEIGTYLGGTTLQLAANSQAQVHILDLPPPGHKDCVQPEICNRELDVYPDQPGLRFQGSPYADRIHQLLGDSWAYDFTPYHGGMDLVLVDGSHQYEYVLRDSQNCLNMMSTDGILIWHDYASYAPGVVRALNELATHVPLVQISETSLVIHQR